VTDFRIISLWSERPVPYSIREDLDLFPPLRRALGRFFARYTGEFTVPLKGGVLTFSLDWDFVMIYDDLPEWLKRLASYEGDATLFFASQGTELALMASREADTIFLSARSLDRDRPLPETLLPIAVPASRFVAEWVRFTESVLDAVAEAEPDIMQDPEVNEYRAAIRASAALHPAA
jgi:hypothetical protein